MQTLGTITIVAPDHNWSMCGHVKTLFTPLTVREVALADGITAKSVTGAPIGLCRHGPDGHAG